MKVVFVDFEFEDRAAIKLGGCEFEICTPFDTEEELVAAAKDADILLIREKTGIVTAGLVDACRKLKLIVTRTVGYDHIDLETARARGIAVCNVPDYGAHVVAKVALGLMLAVARNICRGHNRYRRTKRFSDAGLAGPELYGKTLGVIGVGRIRRHSVRIGKGFGMEVLGCDIAPDEVLAAECRFPFMPLEVLLARSDFVTLHVPLDKTTYHLIDAEALSNVKPSAFLVNTSRGPVVDTTALKEALASGRLRGAGLDVLEDELDVYHDFGDANVVVTPHLCGFAEEACDRTMQVTLDNVRAWMAGEPTNWLA